MAPKKAAGALTDAERARLLDWLQEVQLGAEEWAAAVDDDPNLERRVRRASLVRRLDTIANTALGAIKELRRP